MIKKMKNREFPKEEEEEEEEEKRSDKVTPIIIHEGSINSFPFPVTGS